jgi:hypothetical protein
VERLGPRSVEHLVQGQRDLRVNVASRTTEEARETAPLRIFKPSRTGADIHSVTVTLNSPARVATLVGALVLTGLAAVVFLVGRSALGDSSAAATKPAPVTHTTPRTMPKPSVARPAAHAKPHPRVASGLPARIDHALRYSRVVIVSVSMPGAPVDSIVRSEARAAAQASRAGFVRISALNETAVAALVAKAGVLPEPAVLVVKRPGTVMSTFSVTDSATIAQAVAQARR